jgi:malate synthase
MKNNQDYSACDIPYYRDYISESFLTYLLKQARPVDGVPDLVEVGEHTGLETTHSLAFLCELYELVKVDLNLVLNKRIADREFIDRETSACFAFNQVQKRDFLSSEYKTIIGRTDSLGRIVIGPKNDYYSKAGKGAPIAKMPSFLEGNQVTLFGPPDDPKLSINAMNAYHRKLKNEPAVIEELLATQKNSPFWGADDEDSKTPLRTDLQSAGVNLTECFEGTINYTDSKSNKTYTLEADHLSQPIKRFPGLALPSFFLYSKNNPVPLHLYDFALHLYKNWHNEKALTFYVPKLENEEEARYIRLMIEAAEGLIIKLHPTYKAGTIRLMIVLENPRAVFRVNEIMDELFPYFVGASLGWHDYLASTARLFKEDAHYRIPVKADPNIVIKYIKASHHLLAEVVGSRGGVKVGGMYGILPVTSDLSSDSFQVTMKGFIKDVITQFKRDLTGFWVAHPDFVRIGLALVEAYKQYVSGDKDRLEILVKGLLNEKYHKEIMDFITGPDISGLNIDDPLYARSLLVADIKESTFIANNHPEEIRYNVFQSLQYLTDWLSGNGCVALPASIEGIPVRVMDDLATAERSRWEVWHELHHGRFSLEEFLKIAHEEMHFIRKDYSNDKKIVQVKWNDRTSKWYPVALNLMVKLMTDTHPVEFATELLLPFTIPLIRESLDPWKAVNEIDADKFFIDPALLRFNYYFEMCGSLKFAQTMSANLSLDWHKAEECILSFSKSDVLEAAGFHGDIGENKKTLDAKAMSEQQKVFDESDDIKKQLGQLGSEYLKKFGMKFLVSAHGKTGTELLDILKSRMDNTPEVELNNAKTQLWLITKKRMSSQPINTLQEKLEASFKKHGIKGAQISLSTANFKFQDLALGDCSTSTWFELASLSKTVASAFALEYFKSKNISLNTPVNSLLEKSTSTFRIKSLDETHLEWADQVTIAHLMSHSALNMHYVNGVPKNLPMPKIEKFLNGNTEYGYVPVGVQSAPGKTFHYSGGGFLVLEHLIEALENKSIIDLTLPFLENLGMKNFSFKQSDLPGKYYASGYLDNGERLSVERKMFPSFAAGAMGTAHDMTLFLNHLSRAYEDLKGSGSLSHDTAVTMLFGRDLGCQKFMATQIGLGVFVADAGPNKLAIHQGANDGFRCLYIYCFAGPDKGAGFSILCNAELNGVLFISEVAQSLLAEFKLEGIDTAKFKTQFDSKNIPQEEIVNIGYKNLVFGAFNPNLPEAITEHGPLDPLSKYNLAVGAKILEVSNQKFARAENLLSPFLPMFNPDLFGKQGKIMDSWETVRHNQEGCDTLLFELKKSSVIKYVSVSTKFHLGNQAEFISIDGFSSESKSWKTIIPKIKLSGHSIVNLLTESDANDTFSQIKVSNFPDGGISRLSLFGNDLPEVEKAKFQKSAGAQAIVFKDEIPKTHKPLATPYSPDKEEILSNWKKIKVGDEFDVANLAYGSKLLFASNEHYGPAIQTISPFAPMHMFDGFESARSRKPNHQEELIIELARAAVLHRVVLDFTFFVNNNPMEVSLMGLTQDSKWELLCDHSPMKAFAENRKEILINNPKKFTQLKVVAHPDGGINRVRAYTYLTE